MNSTKLTATLILSGLCLHATSIAAKTFEIDVSAAGLPAFTDCLTFNGSGQFRLARDPLRMSWTFDRSGNDEAGFMATTVAGDRVDTTLRLAIHGRIYRSQIAGNMVNSHGQTFVFHGKANENCKTVGALSAGSSEYSTLPVFDFRPVSVLPPDFPGPIYKRQQQPPANGQHDSPFATAYKPPHDCFGFDCGLPPQPKADLPGSDEKRQSSYDNVIQSPDFCAGYHCGFPPKPAVKPSPDCLESDCPPRPDDPTSTRDSDAQTGQKRQSSFADVMQLPNDCFGFYCGLPRTPVEKPAPDCLEADCAPRPDDPTSARNAKSGQLSIVAGRTYRVILFSDNPGSKLIHDCWKFVADGRLMSKSGMELVWRMDWHNTGAATFQSVGLGGSNHGMAFHGTVSLAKSLEVSGIRSFSGATTGYSGNAYWVPGC